MEYREETQTSCRKHHRVCAVFVGDHGEPGSDSINKSLTPSTLATLTFCNAAQFDDGPLMVALVKSNKQKGQRGSLPLHFRPRDESDLRQPFR